MAGNNLKGIEYRVIAFIGTSLAAVAGFVNAATLLSVLEQTPSHVTGITTKAAIALVTGDPATGTGCLIAGLQLFGSFVLGAMTTGFLARGETWKLGNRYGGWSGGAELLALPVSQRKGMKNRAGGRVRAISGVGLATPFLLTILPVFPCWFPLSLQIATISHTPGVRSQATLFCLGPQRTWGCSLLLCIVYALLLPPFQGVGHTQLTEQRNDGGTQSLGPNPRVLYVVMLPLPRKRNCIDGLLPHPKDCLVAQVLFFVSNPPLHLLVQV